MAGHVLSITIPKNTSEDAPVKVDLPVNEPILNAVGFLFPLNAAYLVGVNICERDERIIPAIGSNTRWVRDDGREVKFDDLNHRLHNSPYVLRVFAYNEDATNNRTIEVRVHVTRITLIAAIENLVALITNVLQRKSP